MILDLEKCKKVEQLFNRGMKTSVGSLASGYIEILSEKKRNFHPFRMGKDFQGSLAKRFLKAHVLLGNSTL